MKKAKTKTKAKKRCILRDAIESVRSEVENPNDQGDWYGELESEIDAMICEPEWEHARKKYNLVPKNASLREQIAGQYAFEWDEDEGENYEIALERMVFAAVKMAMKGRRHSCDPYYDDAFDGYDDGNYGE